MSKPDPSSWSKVSLPFTSPRSFLFTTCAFSLPPVIPNASSAVYTVTHETEVAPLIWSGPNTRARFDRCFIATSNPPFAPQISSLMVVPREQHRSIQSSKSLTETKLVPAANKYGSRSYSALNLRYIRSVYPINSFLWQVLAFYIWRQ